MNSHPAQLIQPPTSTQQPISAFAPEQLIFLAASALLILLIVSFLIPFPLKQSTPTLLLEAQKLTFESESDRERFQEFLSLGLKSGDRRQALANLNKAFSYLSLNYKLRPSNDKREILEKLAQYIEQAFPEETNGQSFQIPCKEEACGAVFVYSPELLTIKDQVSNNPRIEQSVKDAILLNLENAALAAGADNASAQFNTLSGVFQNLRESWKETKDDNTRETAEQILALMEKIDSGLYQQLVKTGYLEFK